MSWYASMTCKCGKQGWCGRDSHRPEEYVCKECNGELNDNHTCDQCSPQVIYGISTGEQGYGVGDIFEGVEWKDQLLMTVLK